MGYGIQDLNSIGEHVEFEHEGFWRRQQRTTKDGWRMGSYRSYVEPLLGRSDVKLTVLPYSTVSKVLITKENVDKNTPPKAYGVEVERFGETLRYDAKKEVIVSAGALGSPHLLMVSGIGNATNLRNQFVLLVD